VMPVTFPTCMFAFVAWRIINAERVACCASCGHCGGHPKCKAETGRGETSFVVASVGRVLRATEPTSLK
jgi:hypothetical protein